MPALLQTDGSAINRLDAAQLTELLLHLLTLEAKYNDIPPRTVDVTTNINAPDGGEDGRIAWSNGPESTDHLPARLTQFQVKATALDKAMLKRELIRDDAVKIRVDEALKEGGAYVIFCNRKYPTERKEELIEHLRETLRDAGAAYADSACLQIRDADAIASWTNNFLSAITRVASWVGRPLISGLKSWSEWESFESRRTLPFIGDSVRETAIDQLRTQLASPRSVIRLTGRSGLGKTRLALEALRPSAESQVHPFDVGYLLCRHAPSDLVSHVSDSIRANISGILVVDECPIRVHNDLKREVERPESGLSLLTIDSSSKETPASQTIRLARMEDKAIRQMLEAAYGDKLHEIDRISRFAQGFPQMAALLAEARLNDAPNMGQLTDDDLLHRMLWGDAPEDNEALQALQACSLFSRFGIRGKDEQELRFVAECATEMTPERLYAKLRPFIDRGVVEEHGNFARVVPTPLAVRLAADWWTQSLDDRRSQLITGEMPGALEDGFCERIRTLDFLPEFQRFTESLCGPQAPFGQAEAILSKSGSRRFRALVEVNPRATAAALDRIVNPLERDDLLNVGGDIRRNLIVALEKLAFRLETFPKAGWLLLRLADAENEGWANNATGQFVQLFSTFLSGTEAPPEERLVLVDRALRIDSDNIRELCVQALGKALDTGQFTRSGGPEEQGTQPRLDDWRPRIWNDAFEYWRAALSRLTEISIGATPQAAAARHEIASHVRGLVQFGLIDELERAIREIQSTAAGPWPELRAEIFDTIRYDNDRLPSEATEALGRWLQVTEPDDLPSMLEVYVRSAPFIHSRDEHSGYRDESAARARDLGAELGAEATSLLEYIAKIQEGDQRQAHAFGVGVAESLANKRSFFAHCAEDLGHREYPNPAFLQGFLESVGEVDKELWDELLGLAATKPSTQGFYPYLLATGYPTREQMWVALGLIEQRKLDANAVHIFGTGCWFDRLEGEVVWDFVRSLSGMSSRATWVALDLFGMYVHGHPDRLQAGVDILREILAHLRVNEKNARRGQLEFYHWERMAVWLVHNGRDADRCLIAEKVVDALSGDLSLSEIDHSVRNIVSALFEENEQIALSAIVDKVQQRGHRAIFNFEHVAQEGSGAHGSSPLEALSTDGAIAWAEERPSYGPQVLIRVAPPLTGSGEDCRFTDLVWSLIDAFGDWEGVLSGLSANLGTFSWAGSLVPMYEQQRAAVLTLADHSKPAVREWAAEYIAALEADIERERRRDAEHELGVYR